MVLGIVANTDKQAVIHFLPELVDWLSARNVPFYLEERSAKALKGTGLTIRHLPAEALCRETQMIISLGGDGTFLSTARAVGRSGIPILGVKLGGMGFLAELARDELFPSLEEILKGSYSIVERMVLEACVGNGNPNHLYALNDLVFDKGSVSRVIRIRTSIGGELLSTYIADGLIISTPTGSTAYSLAAGGPILLPAMDAMIINPLSPHTLSARPVVIPGDKEVTVEIISAAKEVLLSADGQVQVQLPTGSTTAIRKADYKVKLVTYGGRTFYDVLHAKLNWGEDIRQTP